MKNLKKFFVVMLFMPLIIILTACSFGPISAYESWLDEGHEGTQADFLEWLKGEPGATGTPGRDSDVLYTLMQDAFEEELKDPETTYSADELWKFIKDNFQGEQGEPAVTELWTAANRAVQSVVMIKAFFGTDSSRGAGVVYKMIDKNTAYIITNYHVISTYDEKAGKLVVSTDIRLHQYGAMKFDDWGIHDDLAATAKFVGGVPLYDVAVLRLDRDDSEGIYNSKFLDGPMKPAVLPSRYDVTLGQQVIAVGNPLGEGISVTDGIVSVASEDLIMEDLEDPTNQVLSRVIRTSAAINQGNSGGGLFDRQGRLVGIVNARTFEHSSLPVDNMGYAIPLDIAVRLAENIIANGKFVKTLIGINIRASDLTYRLATQEEINSGERCEGEVLTSETVTVESFAYATHSTDDPSNRTKLMVGDVIVTMTYQTSYGANRNPLYHITRVTQMGELMIDCYNVDTITLIVLREEEEVTITLDLTLEHTEPVPAE